MSTASQPPVIQKSFEKDPAVTYVLDPNLRISYCNEAWDRFAAANGGIGLERTRQLGVSVMDVIPQPLKPFFRRGFDGVLTTGHQWSHSYECSSATLFRPFHMRVYPNPEGAGLVVVNSLTVEQPHDASRVRSSVEPFYRDENGLVTMCCECRRTSRCQSAEVWDWVPAFVEKPPMPVSHGICSTCLKLIYPAFVDD